MENSIKLTPDQKQLIEKVGVMNERQGLQPAAARILALLLVSPETELGFDQIRETLNLSKSAASNSLNLLMNIGKIDYVTKPGDRKRYFRNRITRWKDDVKENFDKMNAVADVLEEVLKQRPGNTTVFNQNLKDVVDFVHYLNDRLPAIYQEWEETKK